MAQVRINPKAKNWPYLQAGKYGPGGDFKAECEVMAYELPSEDNPPFDKENDRGPYAYFNVQVRPAGGGIINIRHYEPAGPDSGSRVQAWLTNIGVPVADDGTHDSSLALGKKCIVEASEPRPDKEDPNKKYTKVKALLGAS